MISGGYRNTSNIVKSIHAMANEKKMPGFLLVLYGSYTIQWAVFVVLSLFFGISLVISFNQLKELLGLQSFTA